MTAHKGPSKAVRDVVFRRDGGLCIAQGSSECAGILTLQHRIGRGMGGSRLPEINRPANLIVMCLHHNELIESDADFRHRSTSSGWSIPRNWTPAIEPSDVPVRYSDGPYLLDDDGERRAIIEAIAAELWSVYDSGWAVSSVVLPS